MSAKSPTAKSEKLNVGDRIFAPVFFLFPVPMNSRTFSKFSPLGESALRRSGRLTWH